MTFPKNSAFDPNWGESSSEWRSRVAEQARIDRGLVNTTDRPAETLGATKKLGVVEIPVEQLENWYHVLDDLNNGRSWEDDRVLELRDAVYGFLRG